MERVRGLLEAFDVWKSYGRLQALRGAYIRVDRGDLVGLVGPNGSGKTTLIKVCLGLMARDRGVVRLRGVDPFHDPSSREGVGVVFERPNLPESVRVVDLLERAARIYGEPAERVRWAIKTVGLEGHEHKTFKELSAGLKQRAAIAHSLVAGPEFVVADEPTSNLDPLERRRVLELFAELNRDHGVAFLVSSHVLPEILRVSRRLYVMNSGRTVAEGAPEEILSVKSVARVRTASPEALSKLLEGEGFNPRIEGLSVVVDLGSPRRASRLMEALARALAEGVTVLNVELAERSLEEVMGG